VCKFRADSISFKENKEYEVIINRLKLEVEESRGPTVGRPMLMMFGNGSKGG
jgi:hypothetical protein